MMLEEQVSIFNSSKSLFETNKQTNKQTKKQTKIEVCWTFYSILLHTAYIYS